MATDPGPEPLADAVVVMAWRDLGCPHRAEAFTWTYRWWGQFGWPIVVESSVEPFTRARALNAAVRRAAGQAQVIVQADPDSVLANPAAARQAVELARQTAGLVVSHDQYLYLTQSATAAVYAGRALSTFGPGNCDNHGTRGVGNVTVFSTATWRAAGGYDERFGLWGGDDAAFAYACEAFTQPTRRVPGAMVHLWHPRLPQSEPGGPGYADQFAIVAEYRDAAAVGRHAVRRLVHSRGRA